METLEAGKEAKESAMEKNVMKKEALKKEKKRKKAENHTVLRNH